MGMTNEIAIFVAGVFGLIVVVEAVQLVADYVSERRVRKTRLAQPTAGRMSSLLAYVRQANMKSKAR